MYIYIHINILYICKYIHIYIHIYIYIQKFQSHSTTYCNLTYTWMHISVYLYIYICICIYTYGYVHIYVYTLSFCLLVVFELAYAVFVDFANNHTKTRTSQNFWNCDLKNHRTYEAMLHDILVYFLCVYVCGREREGERKGETVFYVFILYINTCVYTVYVNAHVHST